MHLSKVEIKGLTNSGLIISFLKKNVNDILDESHIKIEKKSKK